MKARCCHYCGQELPAHRLGASLTPKQGRVFDLILQSGDDGMTRADVADLAEMNTETVSVHVAHINEKIRESGYHIKGYGTYRLIQWGKKANTAQPTKADLSEAEAQPVAQNGKQTIPGAVVP